MKMLAIALLATVLAALGCARSPDAVWVEQPWILEAPAGAGSMAGYGVIHNGTAEPRTIAGVDSPAFTRVHLHETRVADGQVHMEPVDSLTLPAGGKADMHPGGLHLMLMAPAAPLGQGDSAEIRFRFANGETLVMEFPVRAGPPGGQ